MHHDAVVEYDDYTDDESTRAWKYYGYQHFFCDQRQLHEARVVLLSGSRETKNKVGGGNKNKITET